MGEMREKIVKIDSTGSTFEYGRELIRCRDCKWWSEISNDQGRCSWWRCYPSGDWYCADAERKEE